MSDYVSPNLRRKIIMRAKSICEYCRTPASFSSQPFSVDHIIPRSKNGKTIQSNLALACQGCNGYKFTSTIGIDPVTRKTVALFHPRKQRWRTHFTWNDDFTLIIGRTPTGRVTVEVLQLNREGCINLRRALYAFGEHPSKE